MSWLTKIFFREKPVATNQVPATPVAEQNSGGESLFLPKEIFSKQPLTILKKYAPLRDFDDVFIENLEQRTLVYAAGATLFKIGQPRHALFYLLQGTIEFRPNGTSNYLLSEDSVMANLPLASGKTFGATAIATTEVKLLTISGNIMKLWAEKSREQVYSVKLLNLDLPKEIADHRFFDSFTQAYRENKLSLPSLPYVATKLNRAMQNDIGVKEVVDIVQVDGPIVTKLIQIANSSLYTTRSGITNCHDAIVRIGLNATRNLVMSVSMKNLFKCNDAKLMKIMFNTWKNSVYLSSLCFVMAEESHCLNPEDALLAGLIANIGVIPILHFAEHYPNEYADTEKLSAAINLLSPSVGSLVLHTLGFSEELTAIPSHAEDWFYQSEGDALQLIDLVILAKLHTFIGSPRAKDLPFINTIPAYSKLKNAELSPELSLLMLQKAQQRIQAITKLFT